MIEWTPDAHLLAAVVLAAGRSTRFGAHDKLLAEWNGDPLVRRPIRAAIEAGLSPVVVVTRADADGIEMAVSDLPVKRVLVEEREAGLSTSLRTGLAALPQGVGGAFILLGDMPLVTSRHLARLAAAFAPDRGRTIVVPIAQGRRGNPVLWGASHFEAITTTAGDSGARHLIEIHRASVVEVVFTNDGVLFDVDRPEDLGKRNEVLILP